ncbi:MAG: histidine kinase [Flavobacteriales bacterium]|nr:histidine kinase [Flavobacteriales bacterium]
MLQRLFLYFLLCFVLVLGKSFRVFGQEFPFKNFRATKDIQEDYFYDTEQDDDGFVWIASNSGLLRFNGTRFKHFSNEKELDEDFYRLTIQGNRILYITPKHQLYMLENNKIIQPQWMLELNKELRETDYRIDEIITDDQNSVWLGGLIVNSTDFVFYRISEENKVEKVVKENSSNANKYCIAFENGRRVLSSVYMSRDESLYLKNKGIIYETKDTIFSYIASSQFEEGANVWYDIQYGGDNTFFFISDFRLLKLDKRGGQEFELSHRINRGSSIIENDSTIWLGMQGNAAQRISFSGTKQGGISVEQYPELNNISGFSKGKNGGIWASSLGKGLFYAPLGGVRKIKTLTKIESITSKGNKLFLGTSEGYLLSVNSLSSPLVIDTLYQFDYAVKGLNQHKGVFAMMSNISGHESFRDSSIDLLDLGYAGSTRSYLIDSTILVGDKGVIRKYNKSSFERNELRFPINFKQYIPIGVKKHLVINQEDEIVQVVEHEDSIQFTLLKTPQKVSNLLRVADGTCFFTDYDSQLYRILKQNEFAYEKLNFKNRLLKNRIRQLDGSSDSLAFLMDNCLLIIQLNGEQVKAVSYPRYISICPSRYTGMTRISDKLYLISNGTVYEFSIGNLNIGKTIPNIVIEHNSTKITSNEIIQLDYTNNAVHFTLSTFDAMSNPLIKYYLDIEGENEIQSYPLNSEDSFLPGLSSGKHQLSVYAMNDISKEKLAVNSFSVVVSTPIWERKDFLGGLLILIFGAIISLFYYRSRIKWRREQLEKNILSLRARAISAKLNPHFIFNAMGSIQYLIAMKKNESADYYLSQFAKLLRGVLENSVLEWYSLSKEIELIQLYLVLENLRFNTQIKFTVLNETNRKIEDLKIPPMMLHVLIENAIIHGLKDSDIEGKIQLKITNLNGRQLQFDVLDNGMGFRPQKKKKEQESLGLNLLKERLHAISKSSKLECQLSYGNKENGEFKAFVCITLPFN